MAADKRDRDVPVYPIGSVEKLTGLTARQIRYYESKGLVSPARTAGKQRLYSPAEVDRLIQVKRLLAEGFSLGNIKELLEEKGEGAGASSRSAEEPYRTAYRSRAEAGLSSLYPVKDEAGLMELLERRREGSEA